MSRIDEMLREMCPEGVEYVELGKLEDDGLITLGRGKVISKKDIQHNPGEYPIYSSSATGSGLLGAYGDYMFDDVRLSWSIDGGGKFFYRDAPRYSVTNVCGWLTVDSPEIIDIKYLYYALSNEWSKKVFDYVHKAHPSVIRKEYLIPLPPLEIQKEIVKVLDKFTEYDTELQAELQARVKQYEYYRNKLLEFNSDIEIKKLGDVFDIRNGYTPSKSNYAYWENGAIPWFRMEDIRENGRILNDSIQHITPEAVKGNLFPSNSVIISTTATIGEPAYITVPFLTNQQITCLFPKAEYMDKINMKFIFYYAFKIGEWCKVHANRGGGLPIIGVNVLAKCSFPLPSLEVQDRIVSVLDNFDKICSDLKIGLPAEIEKRQQQYEYYRDAILTFAEKGEITAQRERESLRRIIQYIFGYVPVKLEDVAGYSSASAKVGNVDKENYIGVDNLLSGKRGKIDSQYVPEKGHLVKYEENDTLIGNIRPYLRKIWFATKTGGASPDILVIKPKTQEIEPRFLYHVLSSEEFCEYNSKKSRGSKMPRGDKLSILKYNFALPSLARQQQIVETLDRFGHLCHDLRAGLPAEIEKRQKQYEYYRDKLLTFPEKTAE